MGSDTMPSEVQFMRLPEVMRVCGRSKTSIYQAVRRGEFPAPVKISARTSGWVRSEIAAWASERVKARLA